jgi:hypothetical protein
MTLRSGRHTMRSTPAAAALAVVALAACTEPHTAMGRAPIINGTVSEPGMFPPVGALLLDGEPWCTGTLVTATAVLTAAHCLDPENVGASLPQFSLALDVTAPAGVDLHAASRADIHPGWVYDESGPTTLADLHDLGVLHLAESIADVESYPLAPAGTALAVGAGVTIVGYGRSDLASEETGLGVKRHARASILEAGELELAVRGPSSEQACNGDSGGPALVDDGRGNLLLVGATSRLYGDGEDCESGSIHTRVDAEAAWLASVIEVTGDPDAAPSPADAAPPADAGPAPPSEEEGDDPGGCSAVTDGVAGGRGGASTMAVALALLLAGAVGRGRRLSRHRAPGVSVETARSLKS